MKFLAQVRNYRSRKKVVKALSSYLKDGRYNGDSRAKTFWLADNPFNQDFCVNNLKRCIHKSFFKRWLLKMRIKSKAKKYDGEIIVLGNTSVFDRPASVKIFNLEKREVATLYFDESKMKRDIDAQNCFKGVLPLVPLLSCDFDNKFVIERLISGDGPSRSEEERYLKLFSDVCACYTNYYKSTQTCQTVSVGDLIAEAEEKNAKDSAVMRSIISALKGLENEIIDLRLIHGDLTYSNMLITEESLYFIDFEHFGYYSFYYDLFWLMQNEYVYEGSSELLRAYFTGEIDDLFEALFDSVGQCFNPDKRGIYYCLFLVQMYNKRVFDNKSKSAVFDYVKKIIDDFQIEV